MPIDTVGNCQNSGISRGCGYDGRPCGALDRSCRKPSRSSSLSRPSRNARAYMPGRGVALEEHLVPAARVVGAAEEVVQPTS